MTTDRDAATWHGLSSIRPLAAELEARQADLGGLRVPITWFIRVDGQLRSNFGTSLHLVWTFEELWQEALSAGDELAWHPHLYHQPSPGQMPQLLTDPGKSREELLRLWEDLAEAPFVPTAFRNGEGWHTTATYETVEHLGMSCDSTSLPGISGSAGHPKNWIGAPNQPYFPDDADLRRPGTVRPLIQVPMTTWRFQAPYDLAPKTRYMNPAVHPQLFTRALDDWERHAGRETGELLVWVLIFHPDEAMPSPSADMLYASCREAVIDNLVAFARRISACEDAYEFTTISEAASRWRTTRVGISGAAE
ncbi:MAG: hypothetical protein GY719_10750 [bacterium]|nr:hypothetical protein [bacterium]